jgi:hypothetical protein
VISKSAGVFIAQLALFEARSTLSGEHYPRLASPIDTSFGSPPSSLNTPSELLTVNRHLASKRPSDSVGSNFVSGTGCVRFERCGSQFASVTTLTQATPTAGEPKIYCTVLSRITTLDLTEIPSISASRCKDDLASSDEVPPEDPPHFRIIGTRCGGTGVDDDRDERELKRDLLLEKILVQVEANAEMVSRIPRIEDSLGRVEVRLDKIEGRLASVEVRLGSVEVRLGSVEADLKEVKGYVIGHHEDIVELKVASHTH